MTATAPKTLTARLQKDFEATCRILAALTLLPKPQRKKAASALAHFEAAGLSLIKLALAEDVPHKSWLRLAAASLTPSLVQAFGAAPAKSVAINRSSFNWNNIAKHASLEHLEAIHASGIDMTGAQQILLDRALKAKGSDIHDFLLSHIDTVWDRCGHLYNVSTPQILRQPEFLARYLQAAKAHHYKDLQWWLDTATWGLSGRNMLILHSLGVAHENPTHVPDGALGAFNGQSTHRQAQMEGWKKDLASLLGDAAALTWAKNELIRPMHQ
jgi:hypothetical protein